jgi:hypothetical protein
MKQLFAICAVVAFSVLFSQVLHAQKPTVADQRIWGVQAGQTYTNEILGLKLTLPNDFTVETPTRTSVNWIPTMVPGSMFENKTLVIQTLLGSSGPRPPHKFGLLVIKLPVQSKNVTGEQILNDRLSREPGSPAAQVEKFGTTTFAYRNTANRFAQLRSYVTVIRGYWVSFDVSYRTEQDLNVLREILRNADFNWVGKK